jgi:hypothetical protein
MSIDYPGNVSGYAMIPPFPPSVFDLKGTVGLHERARMGKINPFKVGLHIIIKCFPVLFEG